MLSESLSYRGRERATDQWSRVGLSLAVDRGCLVLVSRTGNRKYEALNKGNYSFIVAIFYLEYLRI